MLEDLLGLPLLILLVLAIPIAGVVGFFLSLGNRRRLQELEGRLRDLQAQITENEAIAVRAARASAAARQREAPAPDTPRQVVRDERIVAAAEEPAAAEPVAERPAPDAAVVGDPKAGVGASADVPPPPPERDRRSFEERFGTSWVVWIGGLALALGGIFLVRYSIEEGLLGPGARLFLAALLAAALLAAGEWTRRREAVDAAGQAARTAYIPGILTAAGTTVAYATAYAAYAIYGFLVPGTAFVLLGIIALGTLAAALLHGPALAGLGVVGAFVTPLLVASDTPNYWALVIYLAIVTAAAFALARARLWRWLALATVALAALWTLPGVDDPAATGAHTFHVLAGFALAAIFIVGGFLYGPPAESPPRIDLVSSVALGAPLFMAAVLVSLHYQPAAPLSVFTLMLAATVLIAWRSDAAALAVPVAAILAAATIADWALRIDTVRWVAADVLSPPSDPALISASTPATLGALYAAMFGAAGFLAQGRAALPATAMIWAGSGILAPLAILLALYHAVAGVERSIPFAAIALLLAALYAVATESLSKRATERGVAAAAALYAAGSVAALAMALTLALEKGWLTVALALMTPGIAWVAERRPLPLLRTLAAVVATIVLVRIGWEPRIVGDEVGRTPIFNWLLWGYGVPALAFAIAGRTLRRRADDAAARIVEALAILFTVLLVTLQIRHYVTGGDMLRPTHSLQEAALDICAGLALAIGLERVRLRSGSIVHNLGALAVTAMALAGTVFGLWFLHNPMLWPSDTGGALFNLILLGYGIPAALLAALALVTRATRPMPYRVLLTAVAVMTALLYISLQIRRGFHGPVLALGGTSQAEQYAYSVAWLAFGVALLLAGIALRSQPARLISAAVVVLTVAKVFLVDLADLQGVYRALSFIGLGLVLVGIGLIYQKLLFPRRPPAPAAGPPQPASASPTE